MNDGLATCIELNYEQQHRYNSYREYQSPPKTKEPSYHENQKPSDDKAFDTSIDSQTTKQAKSKQPEPISYSSKKIFQIILMIISFIGSICSILAFYFELIKD